MDIEKFLNENKDDILRFDLFDNTFVIHIRNKGKIEIDTGSPLVNFNVEYIRNNFSYGKVESQSEEVINFSKEFKYIEDVPDKYNYSFNEVVKDYDTKNLNKTR